MSDEPAHPDFPHCFRPIKVGAVELSHRIFVPAHTTNFGENHMPSKRHIEYHRARARGGVALVIFESVRVSRQSLGRPQGVNGYDPACIQPFRAIADAVHGEGVPIFGQVIHLGRQVPGEFQRTVGWGPSPIRWAATAAMPHAVNRDDMDSIVASHVVTAQNLLAAGFDGMEVHLGHGHLLQQFLSPSSNQRDDVYGGSEKNRRRFPLEVLRAVRDAVGPDVCMGVRVSGEEFIDGGLHLDEMVRQMIAIAGEVQIDFANTSHSAYHGSYSLATQMADMGMDTSEFRHIPGAFKSRLRDAGLDVPVFSVCSYRGLAEAETMIASGQTDLVGMARAHMADPELVNKSREGRAHEVRPCIGCNQGCAGHLQKDLALTCLTNPRMGLEAKWSEPFESPAAQPRKILVVGAGPAGLEAAWVAAARGHDVTVWEAQTEIGGQLRFLEQLQKRREFLGLLDYQRLELARYGVQLALGKKAISDDVVQFSSDTVVLASGSVPVEMPLPEGGRAYTLDDALSSPDRLGERVAFYDTIGEWSTLAAIEHFAELGKSVTVFCPVPAFSWRTTIYSTFANARRLRERNVRIALMRRVLAFSNGGLRIEDTSTGEVELLQGFDSVVAVQYNRADDGLYSALRAQGQRVHLIGDALAPRTALEAVYEGHELGMSL